MAKGTYKVTAEFELNGNLYKEGDTFTPPTGWERDTAMEELQHRAPCFKYDVQIGTKIEAGKRVPAMQTYHQLLPLAES